MLEEREVLSLLISLFVFVFTLFQREKLRMLPRYMYLVTSFHLLVASWFFSVAEDFFWEEGLNNLQHACSGISALFMAAWCRAIFREKKET